MTLGTGVPQAVSYAALTAPTGFPEHCSYGRPTAGVTVWASGHDGTVTPLVGRSHTLDRSAVPCTV